jgi:hypothetical protein
VLAHGGDPSRIHACVKLPAATVRITQDPNDTCPGESAVDWNIQSAPGAPGPDGFAGPTGPQGLAGPAGRDGADSRLSLRLVTASSPQTAAGNRSADARCPAGRFAVSGAWRIAGSGAFRALESRPLADGRGWRVRIAGRPAAHGWRLIVQATCATQGRTR